MKTRLSLAVLAGVLLLVGLVLAPAAQAQVCFFVGTPPDGRVLGPYFLNSGTNDMSLGFTPEAGRSYSIEAITQQGPSGGGTLAPSININDSFCPTSNIATGVTIRSTELIGGAPFGPRKSLVVTTVPAGGVLEMRLHNADATGANVVVSVTETTLFSPRWSTFGGFYTSWGIQNTTNASCSVTLTVKNTAGTTVASPTFAVAAGAIVFRDTRATDLNVAANQAGKVTLTHDCPPGGIQADAFMVNENVSPPAVVPVVFEPRTAGQ